MSKTAKPEAGATNGATAAARGTSGSATSADEPKSPAKAPVGAAEAAAARAVAAGGTSTKPTVPSAPATSPPTAPTARPTPPVDRPVAKPLVTNPPGGAPTASYPAATTTRETGVREPVAAYSATAAPAAVSAPSAAQPQPAPQATQQPGPQVGQQPGQQAQPGQQHGGPRTARLTVANVDPWSVLKLSFLLSVALGIALVVASVVLWSVLNGMGVFDSINSVLGDIGGAEAGFDIYAYAGFGRVVSLSTVIGVVNVVLITALATVGAFLYNLSAGLVGGLHITLSDD